jgi:hypothetical protein
MVVQVERNSFCSLYGGESMEPQVLSAIGLEVRDDDGHRSLRAKKLFSSGDVILEVRGDVVDVPSRYSIQVDTHVHVEPSVVPNGLIGYDDYLWPFLNHGFEPNSMMDGKKLLAICDIAQGDEITFNYNGNEWDMATPFTCMITGRQVTGNRHLTASQRMDIESITSSFILQLAKGEASVEAASPGSTK